MSDPHCLRQLKDLRRRDEHLVDLTCKRLTEFVLGIRCEAADPDWNQAEMVLHAVRLALRVFPSVRIDVASNSLAKKAREVAKELDREFCDESATRSVTIGASSDASHLRIDASGWLVRASAPFQPFTPFAERRPHPATPLLAACAGIGGAVSLAIGGGWTPRAEISIWDGTEDGPAVPAQIHLEKFHLLSLGSIGSAAAFLLERWPDVDGTITLVDRDTFADHNPARYVAMNEADVGAVKVETIRQRLKKHQALACTAYHGRIENWAELLTDERIPMAIVSFDNLAARAHAADTFPAQSVAALVNQDDAVAVNCDFAKGPCSYCVVGPRTNRSDGLRAEVARMTGLGLDRIAVLTQYGPATPDSLEGLTGHDLHTIEHAWNLKRGALREYKGKRVLSLLEEQRHQAYSSVRVGDSRAGLNLPLPMPSAAAGALALSGALRHQLGYRGAVNEFRYNPMTGTLRPGRTIKPDGGFCLCQDPFRKQIHAELQAE